MGYEDTITLNLSSNCHVAIADRAERNWEERRGTVAFTLSRGNREECAIIIYDFDIKLDCLLLFNDHPHHHNAGE